MKYLELVCVSKEEMACFFHQMSDSRNRVIKKHAGTCITHYALHSLSHFGFVAVDGTQTAGGFFFSERTMLQTGRAYFSKPDKRGTTPGFFPSFCNRANHQFYYFLFAGDAALDMCHVIEVVCLNVVTKIHIIVEYHLSLRTIYNTYTLWQLLKR